MAAGNRTARRSPRVVSDRARPSHPISAALHRRARHGAGRRRPVAEAADAGTAAASRRQAEPDRAGGAHGRRQARLLRPLEATTAARPLLQQHRRGPAAGRRRAMGGRAPPEAEARAFGKDSMETRCLPLGPALTTTRYRMSRIVQTPTLVVFAYDDLTHREIFMDGRSLEAEPNPTWMGYSVGRWEGDVLVVDSNGYTDRSWLDFDGHPAHRGLADHRALHPQEHRSDGRAGHHDRSQGVCAADHLHDTDEAAGRHRAARIGVREQHEPGAHDEAGAGEAGRGAGRHAGRLRRRVRRHRRGRQQDRRRDHARRARRCGSITTARARSR